MILRPREYVQCAGLGKESWGRPMENTSYHSKDNEAFSCPRVFKRKLKSITIFFPLRKNLFKMVFIVLAKVILLVKSLKKYGKKAIQTS